MRAREFIAALTVVQSLAGWSGKAHAQSQPSLDWYLVDGIGGISENGEVAVAATLSPEDSGPMTGAGASIHSVLESGPDYYAPPFTGPILWVHLAENQMILRWSSAYPGLRVEYAATLDGPGTGWTSVMEMPVLEGPQWKIILPVTHMPRFFRLRLFPN